MAARSGLGFLKNRIINPLRPRTRKPPFDCEKTSRPRVTTTKKTRLNGFLDRCAETSPRPTAVAEKILGSGLKDRQRPPPSVDVICTNDPVLPMLPPNNWRSQINTPKITKPNAKYVEYLSPVVGVKSIPNTVYAHRKDTILMENVL
jgi:hypothetical protein